MDITLFFEKFFSFFSSLLNLLHAKAVFVAFGIPVSMLEIVGACIIIVMVISIFWKGAKG